MKEEEEKLKGWKEFCEMIEQGFRPTFCYSNKVTFETYFKKVHFELLDAYNIKPRISNYIPDFQVIFTNDVYGNI